MYGSNLDPRRLKDRAPSWNGTFAVASLQKYELCFNKRSSQYCVAANIQPHPYRKVWGIVVGLTEGDLDRMDRFESLHLVPKQYDRHAIAVSVSSGELVTAETYIAEPDFILDNAHPTSDYLHHVISGARFYNLPNDYIEAISALGQIRFSS